MLQHHSFGGFPAPPHYVAQAKCVEVLKWMVATKITEVIMKSHVPIKVVEEWKKLYEELLSIEKCLSRKDPSVRLESGLETGINNGVQKLLDILQYEHISQALVDQYWLARDTPLSEEATQTANQEPNMESLGLRHSDSTASALDSMRRRMKAIYGISD